MQNLLDTKLESSQDILNQMSQLPECVQNHHLLKDKISHLSKKEKSYKRGFKNVRETLEYLGKDKSKNHLKLEYTLWLV